MPLGELNTCACEKASEAELLAQLDDVLEEYVGKRGALIPVWQMAQAMFGYLPEVALRKISRRLGKPYSEVAGVVSFYSYFTTVPRGKHLVRVCMGTACYVRGGKEVVESLQTALDVEVGQTTADKLFTLEVARCFGACGLAPILMINDDVHPHVNPAEIDNILAQYRNTDDDSEKGGNS